MVKRGRKPKLTPETPAKPVVEEPEVDNPEAEITVQNVDPAWVYSIDGSRGRILGFVVRMSHDPETKQWTPPNEERRRFFVFQPGEGFQRFTMPVDEAVGKNIKRERRVGAEESSLWEAWMATNYVKPRN